MACLMQVLAWHDNRNARCILHAIMSLRPLPYSVQAIDTRLPYSAWPMNHMRLIQAGAPTLTFRSLSRPTVYWKTHKFSGKFWRLTCVSFCVMVPHTMSTHTHRTHFHSLKWPARSTAACWCCEEIPALIRLLEWKRTHPMTPARRAKATASQRRYLARKKAAQQEKDQ